MRVCVRVFLNSARRIAYSVKIVRAGSFFEYWMKRNSEEKRNKNSKHFLLLCAMRSSVKRVDEKACKRCQQQFTVQHVQNVPGQDNRPEKE